MTTLLLAVALGGFTWTFLEYVIHRWMGHDRRFRRTPFGVEHVRHHIEGDYFAPTWKKLLAALVATSILCGPAILVAGARLGVAYVLGLMASYGLYEFLHRRNHTHPGLGPYGHWARRHHFHHHFVDGRTNHGVTSPLWDFVFATYQRPQRIKVPAKLVMAWLTDPATGKVIAAYADSFELTRSPHR